MSNNGLFWMAMALGFCLGIVAGIMVAGYSFAVVIKGFLSEVDVSQINFNLNETKLVETAFKLGNWSNVTG